MNQEDIEIEYIGPNMKRVNLLIHYSVLCERAKWVKGEAELMGIRKCLADLRSDLVALTP